MKIISKRFNEIGQVFSFELLFILFLFAGLYKADPRLAWVPVDLTALFFGLSVISGLVILLKRGIVLNRKAIILCLLYMAFAGYALFTYLWTPGKVYSTQKILYIWTLVLWAVAAPALIISPDPRRLKRLGIIFSFLLLVIVFEAIIQYFQGDYKGFINVLGSSYLGLGYVVGIGFLIIIAYLIYWSQSLTKKIMALILAFIYFWILLIAGGRGPLIATILASLMPMIFAISIKPRARIIKIRRYFKFIFFIILIAFVLSLLFIETDQIPATLNRMLVLAGDDMGASAEARIQSYKNAINYWSQAPLFGHGIGAWPIINNGIDMRGYPHNIVLEIMAELGMVGLLLFTNMVIYALSFISPFKTIGNSPIRVILIMLLILSSVNTMISGDIPDNRLFFACIGLFPAISYLKGRKQQVNI